MTPTITKERRVLLRLTESQHKALKHLAAEEDRSVQYVASRLITQALATVAKEYDHA